MPSFSKELGSRFDDDLEICVDNYLMEYEENLIWRFIEDQFDATDKNRSRNSYARMRFSDTTWGKMIMDETIENPRSRTAKKFRRRFRLPYPLFKKLVEIVDDKNIFHMKYVSKIPTAARVLACLRILGRDTCGDDVEELSNIRESTAISIFHQFIEGMVKEVYPSFVKTPLQPGNGAYLREVLTVYANLGLPGCIGSMDGTRIKWAMCPKRLRHSCVGKEGFPTLVFQVVVDHFRRIQYVSSYYLGSNNDVTICHDDYFTRTILNGALDNISYKIYGPDGREFEVKGGYLITDGGFVDSIRFIDPDHTRLNRESVLWSEWVESVRKDVECAYSVS